MKEKTQKGTRIAFLSVEGWKFGERAFEEVVVDFDWYPGMAREQKIKSSISMQEKLRGIGKSPLEVSRHYQDEDGDKLGSDLSAINLKLKGSSVETIFQAYKKMNDGGPYLDLLKKEGIYAKLDCRIQTSESKQRCRTNNVNYNKSNIEEGLICEFCKKRKDRKLVAFSNKNKDWDTDPKSLFYDSVYITALSEYKDLTDKLCNFNAFIDINFNQKIPYSKDKGAFNCQARSCAIFVTLYNAGKDDKWIKELIKNPQEMKKLYGLEKESEQISLPLPDRKKKSG